jgi:hypothetical protein
MSGILDNKSRIIDAMLTFEGRQQLAAGKFKVKYATFSDKNVVYQVDLDNGHVDPTYKIYLESFNSPSDQIIFTADDSGRLVPFRQHSAYGHETLTGSITSSVSWTSFVNGTLLNRIQNFSTNSVGNNFSEYILFQNDFNSQIEGLLNSSIDNFNNLQILGSIDSLFDYKNFAVSSNEIEFSIDSTQENLQMVFPTDVNTIDSLFNDEKLRNLINFRYLPPIKKAGPNVDLLDVYSLISNGLVLGDYRAWGPIDQLNFSDIKNELNKYENNSKTIIFDPTSLDNEIVAQFFEITDGQVNKLDVIDYGKTADNSNNPLSATNQIFFVGKVVVDDSGSDCFVHLFTLVFGGSES